MPEYVVKLKSEYSPQRITCDRVDRVQDSMIFYNRTVKEGRGTTDVTVAMFPISNIDSVIDATQANPDDEEEKG